MALVCNGGHGLQTHVWSDGFEEVIRGATVCSGAIWIKINDWGEAAFGDVVAAFSGNAAWITVAVTKTDLTVSIRTTNSSEILSYAFTPLLGTWYHIAFTHDKAGTDGKRQKIYVDGVEVADANFANDLKMGNFHFGQLGPAAGDNSSYSFHWPGVWAEELSATEVADLASDTKPKDLTTTPAYSFAFGDQTAGAAQNTDSGFDSSDDTKCPDLINRTATAGIAIWDGADPLADGTPALTSTVVSKQTRVVASGSTTNLGNLSKEWSDSSTSAAFDIHFVNSGTGDTLNSISLSITGDATVVDSLPTTLEQGESAVLRISLDAATIGSKTTTITVESNDLSADHTLTLDWHVRSDTDTNIEVGTGFGTEPTESDTPHGSGVSYRIAAEVDIPDLLHVRGDTIEFCALWSHDDIAWLDKLEVYFENDTAVELYNNRMSSRTGLQGVTGTLDNSSGTDGTKKVFFKFIPVNGKERLIEREITFNGSISATRYVSDQGDDSTGNGTSGSPYLTVEHALAQLSTGPGIVKCLAGMSGKIELGSSNETVRDHAYCTIVEPDGELTYEDITLYLVSANNSGQYQSKHRKVQFENLRFDIGTSSQFVQNHMNSRINFVDCAFTDGDGAGGTKNGRHSTAVRNNGTPPADSQLFWGTYFQSVNTQFGLVGLREWIGYSGPTGHVLVCGSYGGDHALTYHGGDHAYGYTLFGGVGWVKATGVDALIRYTDTYLVRAASVTDNLNETWTLNLSGSPYMDAPSIGGELSTRVRVSGGTYDGEQWKAHRVGIVGNSAENPTKVTTTQDHKFSTGQRVTIFGQGGMGAVNINGEHAITRIDDTTFSIPVDATAGAGSGGVAAGVDNTNHKLTVTSDASGLAATDDLLVVAVQHSDLAQHNFQNDPDGNAIMQAVDARDINSGTQMRLPQKTGGLGEVEGWAMQLVAFNQKAGTGLGYQEENETNSRFDHCTFKNALFINSTPGACTDCTVATTVIDRLASGWATTGVVAEAGPLSVPGFDIDTVPDYYSNSMKPKRNGGLKGMAMPLLPYDLAGEIRVRGGNGYIGAYEALATIPPAIP